jgi:IclR family transcriptional regulator, acetate operon repressor
VESLNGVRLAARPGIRDPIHSTAIGKAIAGQLAEDQVRALLEPRLPRYTDRTITSVEDYLTELEKVRVQGYAVDDEEQEIGVRCVAVPLPGAPALTALSPARALLHSSSLEQANDALHCLGIRTELDYERDLFRAAGPE